jgi:dihydrofolate synthase/folylpolyglutamate synthase
MSSPSDPPARSASRDFLLGRENYERWRTMPYDQQQMGLERMRRLLAELGSPEQNLPVIHVAGTKGKGSTAAMIAAALTAAGYRTGLFTSPHLERIEERIRVDGQCIEAEEFDALVEAVRPAVERMDGQETGSTEQEEMRSGSTLPAPSSLPIAPTFFEIITAMAFVYFAREKLDAAVMEVGLGGRLDATNVCRPAVSVITSISFDHTQQLGNTLALIAGEKAGIIKPGVPVVSGVIEPEPRDVIRRIAYERGAPLIERGSDFDFTYEPARHLEREAELGRLEFRRLGQDRVAGAGPPTQYSVLSTQPSAPLGEPALAEAHLSNPTSYPLSLPGKHQAANAATALAAIDVLRKAAWKLPDEAIAAALAGMSWPARVEVVARRPAVVFDAAHNVASVEALVETLHESFSVARRIMIFGTTQDKDVRGMLAVLLPAFDEVYFTRYRRSTRAVPPEELQRLAEELTGRRSPVFDDSSAAWSAARRAAGPDDMICITGSFFLAAEMRENV